MSAAESSVCQNCKASGSGCLHVLVHCLDNNLATLVDSEGGTPAGVGPKQRTPNAHSLRMCWILPREKSKFHLHVFLFCAFVLDPSHCDVCGLWQNWIPFMVPETNRRYNRFDTHGGEKYKTKEESYTNANHCGNTVCYMLVAVLCCADIWFVLSELRPIPSGPRSFSTYRI